VAPLVKWAELKGSLDGRAVLRALTHGYLFSANLVFTFGPCGSPCEFR
jgi:hypothetical protein